VTAPVATGAGRTETAHVGTGPRAVRSAADRADRAGRTAQEPPDRTSECSSRATTTQASPPDDGRWELLRALGALTVISPPHADAITTALGLPSWSRSDHTRLFVLDLPPYASIHLGAEGKLGGDGADRVAGLWRTLDLLPPNEPDHLAALLALVADLGSAGDRCATEAARRRLAHVRRTVLHEHLWSWLPGYLAAIADDPAGAPWAELTLQAVGAEVARSLAIAGDTTSDIDADHDTALDLPAALRDAPPPIGIDIAVADLLDALVAPVRVGMVLTWRDLRAAADRCGLGLRRGERRFALRAMIEQDPAATLGWLAEQAQQWARRHATQPQPGPASRWWRARAETTATTLTVLATAD
jgi:TorA maturation chaperone TorD